MTQLTSAGTSIVTSSAAPFSSTKQPAFGRISPAPSFSSVNAQRAISRETPATSTAPRPSQATSCVSPFSYSACSMDAATESPAVVSPALGEPSSPQPAANAASAATATNAASRRRVLLALLAVAVTGVIVPAAAGGGAVTPSDAGLPDIWSGIWPAQLMNDDGTETPLGTLTWKPIRYEDGIAVIGKNFGGQAFTGCPDDGRTRFFRGHYMEGGDLIACTRGEDTKELVGRFNGREDFRSGSFVVRMISDGFFLGKYDEDGGITTKWCGDLKERLTFSSGSGEDVDTAAPTLRFRSPSRAAVGTKLKLTLAARDGSRTSVDVSMLKGAKAITRMNGVAVRADGTAKVVSWRVPRSAKGTLRICAAAFDRAGNASRRTCVRLTVT